MIINENYFLPRLTFILLAIVSIMLISGCSDDHNIIPDNNIEEPDSGHYVANSVYKFIRNYPGGNGVFVIWISPSDDFTGEVSLSVDGESQLNARLTTSKLTRHDTVAEIIISPDTSILPGNYGIVLNYSSSSVKDTINFNVEILNWEGYGYETSITERDNFKSWLLQESQYYTGVFANPELHYSTYPQIIIVEHHTLLTTQFEIRVCWHVMVPPHDWSMIRIRDRKCPYPIIAAKRESDGTINKINVSEYPTFMGY